MMKKDPTLERSVILYVWIYCILVSIILAIISKYYIWPISFVLGTVTSLLCFTRTIKTVDKVIKYDDERKKNVFIKNNLFNYLIYLIVLAFSSYTYYRHLHDEAITKYFDIWCTLAGCFSVKIIIYIKIFIIDKIFKNRAKIEYKDEVVTPAEHQKLEEQRQEKLKEELELEEKKEKDPFYEFDHKYDEVDKKWEDNKKGGDTVNDDSTINS